VDRNNSKKLFSAGLKKTFHVTPTLDFSFSILGTVLGPEKALREPNPIYGG